MNTRLLEFLDKEIEECNHTITITESEEWREYAESRKTILIELKEYQKEVNMYDRQYDIMKIIVWLGVPIVFWGIVLYVITKAF